MVGTGSLRRRAQLRCIRDDLEYTDIRGNVDTRIKKLTHGDYDALVLAAAGLRRMGLEEQITETFEPNVVLPAVGQGALAITGRRGDKTTLISAASVRCASLNRSATHSVCVRASLLPRVPMTSLFMSVAYPDMMWSRK